MTDRYVCRFNSLVTPNRKEWRARGRTTLIVGGTPPPDPDPNPPGTSLYAGHIPNRVLLGMSTAGDGTQYKPGWTEANQILNRTIYMHREFVGGNFTASWLNGELAWHAQRGLYPLLSMKYANWAGIYGGNFDSDWAAIRNIAKGRRTAGPGGTPLPFSLTFNHEPDGDGVLLDWGRAHIYLSNYFAGWGTNTTTFARTTYNVDNDVSDIMSWHCIPNGHWFGPKNVSQAKINDALPPLLWSTFKANRSIVVADTYDPNPNNKDDATDPNRETPPFNYTVNADRASRKIQAFVDYARGQNSGAIGIGEFSATTAEEVTACWVVARDNRDILGIMSYFNSANNSRWNWRLIPNGYPAGNPDVFKDGEMVLRDFGGNPVTEAKLLAYRAAIDQSISPLYTGPV